MHLLCRFCQRQEKLLWEIWTFFGHTVFLVWWFGGRFRKYTLTMEDSWWSGWRISIGSVSTPNGRAGWLMYQGSRRWGGWADSFVSGWAQYSVHILCVHMAYLHIACVHMAYLHIAHYTLLCVHSWLAHCLFTDCFCAHFMCAQCLMRNCLCAKLDTMLHRQAWTHGHRAVTMQCAVFVSVQNTVCTHFGASRLKQASFAESPTSGATVYIV